MKSNKNLSEDCNGSYLYTNKKSSADVNLKIKSDKSAKEKKSVTEEVSEILTNLPEATSKYVSNKTNKISDLNEKKKEKLETLQQTNSPDESLTTSSNDEDESEAESSDLDDDAISAHRDHCVDQMSLVEKQFIEIKDLLHKERYLQITKRLDEVESETAPEYLQQLRILQQQKEVKFQVAEILRNLRLESLEICVKAEKLANTQDLNNKKKIIIGKIKAELDEKKRRLEEDRDNVEAEYWSDPTRAGHFLGFDDFTMKGKRNKKKEDFQLSSVGTLKRKKKPVTVTGPYIVYMLKDGDIFDDWIAIKKAVTVSHRRAVIKRGKKQSNRCRFENGKFYFGGKLFTEGQDIAIKNVIHSETKLIGTIENVSSNAICIRQNNGKRSKLRVHMLQKGIYSMHHK